MSEPGNSPVTFTDYAAHIHWMLAHLLEFLGFALIFGALLVISWRMRAGRATSRQALIGVLKRQNCMLEYTDSIDH